MNGLTMSRLIESIVRSILDRYARVPDDIEAIEQRLTPLLMETFTDPDLRFLFFRNGRSVESKNEVPIYFGEEDRNISGQIDRLILSTEQIIVVDYKTGEMEAKHKHQMRIYEKGIEKIFPGRSTDAILVYLEKARGEKITKV